MQGKENDEAQVPQFCATCGRSLAPGAKCPSCSGSSEADTLRVSLRNIRRSESRLQLFGDKMLIAENESEGEYKPVTLLLIEMVDTSALQKRFSLGGIYRFSRRYVGFVETQVRRHGGALSRSFGGAIVAVFGAPLSREDHARRGCEAAWKILNGLPSLFPREDDSSPLPALQLSLVSGPALFHGATPGAPVSHEDFDGLKDLVPAARSLGRPGKIVVERSTYELAKPFFSFRPVTEVSTADIREAVEMYELIRPKKHPAGARPLRLQRLSTFVGREAELSSLFEAAGKARTGHGQVVAVWGDAGIGKSRLVEEFTSRLADRIPCRNFSGYCMAYASAAPYHPILEIVRSCCGIRAEDAQAAAKKKIRQTLEQLSLGDQGLASPLSEMLALPVDDEAYKSLTPPERKGRVFHAVATLLCESGRERLLVVTVEALHWVDQSSEELLHFLCDKISDSAMLLILLFRPEYQGMLRTAPDLTSLHLDGISSGYVRELVRSILGSPDLGPAAMRLIEEKTGENPLFVEELTQTLVAKKAIRNTEEGAILDESKAREIVPAGIQTVISARLDLLKPKVKATLQVASVIGRGFSQTLLQKVLGEAVRVERHLLLLGELEFVYEMESRPDAVFVFKHALTQDAVYQSLTPGRRKNLHAKIGAALEELYTNNADQVLESLAHHYLSCENWQKARHYLRLAGDKARRQNSLRNAYRFYRQSFGLWEKGPQDDATRRGALDTAMAMDWVAVFLDAPEGYKELLEEAEKLAVEMGDSGRLEAIRSSLSMYGRVARQPAIAADQANQCLEILDERAAGISTRQELAAAVPAAFNEIGVLFTLGRFALLLPYTTRLIDAIQSAHCEKDNFGMAVNPYLSIAGISVVSYAMVGEFDAASSLYERVMAVAPEINDSYGLGWLEIAQAIQNMERGHLTEAEHHQAAAMRIFQEANLPSEVFWSSMWAVRGVLYHMRGDCAKAIEHLNRSINISTGHDAPIFISRGLYEMGLIHMHCGDLSAAEEFVRSAIEWAEKCGEEHFLGLAKMAAGRVHARVHPLQIAKAEALILQGIEILRRLGVKPFVAEGYLHLGEFYFESGWTDRGIKNLRKAERMFKSMQMPYWLEKVRHILKAH
ncbi:MAG: AAA family ATPase [Desulfomonile sp.]|nr:AAA family ATPase [Desulfomonile sp.]